jgi:hypothetical protein
MSKSNVFETDFLELIFNATALSSIATASTSTALWVALHTATPDETGNQSSNESAYTSYARVLTQRSTATGGWAISGNAANPVSAISFPQATSTSTSTVTHASVGLSSAGAGYMIYYGALSPTINVSQNVTPQLSTASAITED